MEAVYHWQRAMGVLPDSRDDQSLQFHSFIGLPDDCLKSKFRLNFLPRNQGDEESGNKNLNMTGENKLPTGAIPFWLYAPLDGHSRVIWQLGTGVLVRMVCYSDTAR